MTEDLDDLVGGGSAKNPWDDDYHPDMERHTVPKVITELHGGVSITFLAQLFGMAKHTVSKRLGPCNPIKRVRNAPVYNLCHAAAYLVEPKVDLQEYLRTLRPTEMPTHLQKDFWDAMNKRQKWELEARELWRTEDVLEVMGEVAKMIKTTSQLWVDNLERLQGMTDQQRAMLVEAVDALQNDVYQALVDLPQQRKTLSVAEQVDENGLPLDPEKKPDGK